MSMEKRCFTSDLNSLSQASLTFWMGMTLTSAVTLSAPQKSNVSSFWRIPPMMEPERLRRPNRSERTETAKGFPGAPTGVTCASRPSRLR